MGEKGFMGRKRPDSRRDWDQYIFILFKAPPADDGKDLIHEGIETFLPVLLLFPAGPPDGKDLIHEGIETKNAFSACPLSLDGKDLIHEGIETSSI